MDDEHDHFIDRSGRVWLSKRPWAAKQKLDQIKLALDLDTKRLDNWLKENADLTPDKGKSISAAITSIKKAGGSMRGIEVLDHTDLSREFAEGPKAREKVPLAGH